MFSYIVGKLVEIQEGSVIVETNGIGYEICVSNTSLSALPSVGRECKLFCQLIFNSNDAEMALFGFATKQEKNMFLLLTSISGVGPKIALSILSAIKVDSLTNAIMTNDVRTISSAKGIGKKTAERIVLELREKVGSLSTVAVSSTATDSVVTNVLEALESMGLPRQQAYEPVMRARQVSSDFSEIIRIVLKGLNSNG